MINIEKLKHDNKASKTIEILSLLPTYMSLGYTLVLYRTSAAIKRERRWNHFGIIIVIRLFIGSKSNSKEEGKERLPVLTRENDDDDNIIKMNLKYSKVLSRFAFGIQTKP